MRCKAQSTAMPQASHAFATPQRAPYRVGSDFRFQRDRPLARGGWHLAAGRAVHALASCDLRHLAGVIGGVLHIITMLADNASRH